MAYIPVRGQVSNKRGTRAYEVSNSKFFLEGGLSSAWVPTSSGSSRTTAARAGITRWPAPGPAPCNGSSSWRTLASVLSSTPNPPKRLYAFNRPRQNTDTYTVQPSNPLTPFDGIHHGPLCVDRSLSGWRTPARRKNRRSASRYSISSRNRSTHRRRQCDCEGGFDG